MPKGSPETVKRHRLRRVARLAEAHRALKSRPCTDCGVQYPHYVMQFDHLPGYAKSRDVSASNSITAMLLEAAKCELVCANCHAARTWMRLRESQAKRDSKMGPTLFD